LPEAYLTHVLKVEVLPALLSAVGDERPQRFGAPRATRYPIRALAPDSNLATELTEKGTVATEIALGYRRPQRGDSPNNALADEPFHQVIGVAA
jgi:hypothetical protein